MSIRQGNNIIAGNISAMMEVGDIGQCPFGIDESKNLRRYLNGQVILQEQFKALTKKLKKARDLMPQLFITNTEFDTEVANSDLGQCGKFVIDDAARTIRLPRIINIQGLTDLKNAGSKIEAGLPNITGKVVGWGDRTGYGSATPGALSVEGQNQRNLIPTVGEDLAPYHSYAHFSLDASRSNPHYGKSDTVQEEAIQYPYFIQVAAGSQEVDSVVNEYQLNNPYTLLDYKYTDNKLFNTSWLLSDGNFHDGNTYVGVYEGLLIELNPAIAEGTVTEAGYIKRGLTVKNHTDVITDFDYVINQDDRTFKLPAKTLSAPQNDHVFLYFYVGETVQNANLINIGKVGEKTNTGLAVGALVPYLVSSNWIPSGYLPTNGAEYVKDGIFEQLWNNFLTIQNKVKKEVKLPNFTSNSVEGYTVSDSDNSSTAWTLVNGGTSKQVNSWGDYKFTLSLPKNYMLKYYTIGASSSTIAPCYPTTWKVLGSNDNSHWNDVHITSNEQFSPSEEKVYSVDSNVPYKYYQVSFVSGMTHDNIGELGKISFVLDEPSTVLETCTYPEYTKEVQLTGECLKWAVDEAKGVFRVPTKKDEIPNSTATTLPVRGNGMNLGFTNGVENYSCGYFYGSSGSNSKRYYGQPVGSKVSGSSDIDLDHSTGLTLDPAKSGIVADYQLPVNKVRYFVYVANAVINESAVNWNRIITELGKKADINLVNTNTLTNCITEIPQDIKVELKDGVLTLKAGSKVYVPNGPDKFDEVIIDTDKTLTNSFTGTYSDIAMVYRPDVNKIVGDVMHTRFHSGETDALESQSGVHYWYDTKNNIGRVKEGAKQIGTMSLPFCLMQNKGHEGFKAINQVFNGFGYIGSTVFALPGVKGLIPDGRNEDGSLKNIEFVITSVKTHYQPSDTSIGSMVISSRGDFYWQNMIGHFTNPPAVVNWAGYYNINENIWYFSEGDNKWAKRNYAEVAYFSSDASGKITSFVAKNTPHTLNYDDKELVSGWVAPGGKVVNLVLGASGASYVAPANGYFDLRKGTTGDQWIKLAGNVEFVSSVVNGAASGFLYVKKGQRIVIEYTASGTIFVFRFVYAEGAM